MNIIPTQIVSALNNYKSIAPIVTKDLTENVGRTMMAYHSGGRETKKYEATEKFIEANMASLLWYGAIPLTKKIFNATVFKGFKFNPNVSLEYLKDKTQNIKSVLNKIEEAKLPGKILKKGKIINTKNILNKIGKNASMYKGLHISRMLISTIIPTVLSAVALPKAIIAFTQYKVNHDMKKQKNTPTPNAQNMPNIINFSQKTGKNVAFKSLGETLLNKATQAQTSLLGDMVAFD